ncbi:MAG: hypothetical protein H6622_07515 [Halobacteriovoraceae bacterium]|nr:hypothetical protein [Halobacteriovoraceae bacterium]
MCLFWNEKINNQTIQRAKCCKDNEVGIDGVCRTIKSEGEICGDSEECKQGLSCRNGICVK